MKDYVVFKEPNSQCSMIWLGQMYTKQFKQKIESQAKHCHN